MTERALHRWLGSYRAAWWRRRYRYAITFALPVAVSCGAVTLLLENLFHFAPLIRTIFLFVTSLPLLAGLAYTGYARWRMLQNTTPDDGTLARFFRHIPGGHGRLLNAVELQTDPSSLSAWAVERLESELAALSPESCFDWQSPMRKFYRRMAITAIFLTIIIVIPGGSSALARLLQPQTDFKPPAPFRLEWTDNTENYPAGEPLSRIVKLIPSGIAIPPTDGEVLIAESNSDRTKSIPLHFTANQAELRLPNPSGVMELVARVKGISSEKLSLTPFYRIRLTDSKMTILPPGYSGQPPREASGGGDQAVLAGTRIDWTAKTTGDIGVAMLLWNSGTSIDTIGVKYTSRSLQANFTIRKAGILQLVLRDNNQRDGAPPPPLRFELLPDESPRVTLLAPEVDGNIPGSFQIPIIARADDDFGIGAMYLVFRSVKANQPGNWDSLKIPFQKIEPASAGIASEWDASRYDLIPDDGIEFFVTAFDGNNISGPGRGVSEIRRMKVPSLEHWLEESEAAHDAVASELESLSKNGERVAQSLEALAQKIKRKGELSHEEQEQLRSAGERQQELVERAEKAAKELRQLSKKMEESGAAAKETMEKLSRLQELMEELASPELKDALKQLQEAVKKLDQNQIKAAMQQFQIDQKEWKEKLDRTLALLEQLRLERRLDMLEQWSKKVAEQARRNDLSVDSASHNPAKQDSLSKEQGKLSNESKALEEQAAKTADDAAKSPHLDPSDAQTLRDAEKSDQAASQPLRQSANSLQQNQPSSGKQNAKQGAQRAEKLAEQIAQMNKKLRENAKNDLADKMGRRIGELLELSKTQDVLTEQYSVLDARTPQARTMAERQEAIRRGLGITMDSIAALGRETFFLPRTLMGELRNAQEAMGSASRSITERMTGVAKPAQIGARGAMTQGAALLMQAMGEMQKSSSSTGYEEMMRALSEMARRQAEINDKTGEMSGEQGMPMPGGGDQPMDSPGGSRPGGTTPMPGMNGGLQQLAAEQGALSQMMNQLEQQAQQMKELTGRLNGIGDQMSESEKQLRDKTITDRTQRLQQRILTRLLDAQRSLQRQDYTQKRESKTGSELGGRVNVNFDASSIENQLRQRLLDLSRMGVDPLWQQRIRSYWQSLQQANADSTR